MQITYSARFEKQYRKLPDAIKELFEQKEDSFMANPFHDNLRTHKLKGALTGYYAFSLNNKYRAMFSFENDQCVRFHCIGTHDIYE